MKPLLMGTALLVLAAAAEPAAPLLLPPGQARVVVRSAARPLPVRELGLREAGLAAGPVFPRADEIRIFDSAAKTNESPRARLWLNSTQTNRYWFHTGGRGSAEGYVIPRGAAVAVVTRASTNAVSWTCPLPETRD